MNSVLFPHTSSLLVIDWQERLFPAMPDGVRDHALARASDLVWMAQSLEMPVLATEQYPKGLGPTLAQLGVQAAMPKTTFSALKDPAITEAIAGARPQVILTGMETHICVAQTVRDLCLGGRDVWVVADACLSRRRLDWELGLERMRGDGARIVTAEAVLFELLGQAGGPFFKELSRRIR